MTTGANDLVNEVFERLLDADAPDDLIDAVLAAAGGIDAFVAWTGVATPTRPTTTSDDIKAAPTGVFLTGLRAEGFRGIGPRSHLTFAPGPGLHVIVGRNGCGKSSFAEALEVLLTGSTRRFEARTEAWREGWRNLHHTSTCEVQATAHIEGQFAQTILTRNWPAGATDFSDSPTKVQTKGQPVTDLHAIGWATAVRAYKPMLCAIDFDDVAGKPSALHDLLVEVLGLEPYNEAKKRLEQHDKELRSSIDLARKDAASLIDRLRKTTDTRATACLTAINGDKPPWDLDTLRDIVLGDFQPDSDVTTLHELRRLSWPNPDEVATQVAHLRQAADALGAAESTAAHTARLISSLLDDALQLHDDNGDQPCPVCGRGHLDAAWRAEATATNAELKAATSALNTATSDVQATTAEASGLMKPVPRSLSATVDGVDCSGALAAWTTWTTWAAAPVTGRTTAAARGFADHLENTILELDEALHAVVAAAAAKLQELDAAWRPLAADLAAWIPHAAAATDAVAKQKIAKDAVSWFKAEIDRLRTARFQLLAAEAQIIFERLSYRSNVSLLDVKLEGENTRRRVGFSLSVDDTDAGLGVLSQGEVNALALAMFVPRATRAESPFRFLVIDDPVQSMNPAKVDGLAQLLSELAKTRQVIVLTHDDRLPQAIRRLGLPASVVELARGEQSVVEARPLVSPAVSALQSAKAIAADKTIATDLQDRIIPGFCRMALEAAFTDLAWNKMLSAGKTHAEIEGLLDDTTKLYPRASLGLFANDTDTDKVLSRLNTISSRGASAFKACNEGTHVGVPNAALLIGDIEQLIGKLA